MPRPMPQTDLVDEVKRMQEEIRRLRIRGEHNWNSLVLTYEESLNTMWFPSGYADVAAPSYPDGNKCGVYRSGDLVIWEGGVTFWDDAPGGGNNGSPQNLLKGWAGDLSGPRFYLPEEFRPVDFFQQTLFADVNNNSTDRNFWVTFQAANDGWVGFSSFVWYGPATYGATTGHAWREDDLPPYWASHASGTGYLNFDGVVYRGQGTPFVDEGGDDD